MTKTFGTAKEAREFLAQFGFEPFKKGLTKATLTAANGRKATLGMGILGKTGQSSTGAGWGYVVTVDEVGR